MSKRRHNFGTKRFKEKSLFIFHVRIALKSLILLFVRLIARGARIRKTHRQTDRQTDRHTDRGTVTLAHARRGLITVEIICATQWIAEAHVSSNVLALGPVSQDILTLGYFVAAAKYPRILCC